MQYPTISCGTDLKMNNEINCIKKIPDEHYKAIEYIKKNCWKQ